MYKGVIYINPYYKTDSTKYQAQRIKAELSAFGAQVCIRENLNTDMMLMAGGRLTKADFDFAVFFDKDKYLPRMLEAAGVRVFNSSRAIELSDDKFLTHIALTGRGINMPASIAGALCYTDTAAAPEGYLESIAENLGLPLVVKESYGSLGKGVYLVKNLEELRALHGQIAKKPHFFQQFIAESAGVDTRVITVGGKVAAAMERRAVNDFRSNIGLGGTGSVKKLDKGCIEMAEKASAALGLDFAGIDILTDKHGQPVLCEVNSNAFFNGIEEVTGVNIARAYAAHILYCLNKI